MAKTLATLYLEDVAAQFRQLKGQADRALAQVSDGDLVAVLDPQANSIAVLVRHVAGNLLSRWTDLLTSDGEKPDRDRDGEFVTPEEMRREELLAGWEAGWRCLFAALAELSEDDLGKTVAIRAEPHSVPRAIHRQLTHQAYHVGQIVLLAKHFAAARWETLSIPRGKSREHNARMFAVAGGPGPEK
jgi:hypothetical protein